MEPKRIEVVGSKSTAQRHIKALRRSGWADAWAVRLKDGAGFAIWGTRTNGKDQ
jgi:xanthine/CO dehydrogenase XdhC/CoxF family maturation factor